MDYWVVGKVSGTIVGQTFLSVSRTEEPISNRNLYLNQIEMLWQDLEQAIHAKKKPSNLPELKQYCKEVWAKIIPQRCERLI